MCAAARTSRNSRRAAARVCAQITVIGRVTAGQRAVAVGVCRTLSYFHLCGFRLTPNVRRSATLASSSPRIPICLHISSCHRSCTFKVLTLSGILPSLPGPLTASPAFSRSPPRLSGPAFLSTDVRRGCKLSGHGVVAIRMFSRSN